MVDVSPVSVTEAERFEQVCAFLAGQSDRMIETGIARIYLGPSVAWKIKRPVALGYLDYSSPAKRQWALDRELDMNRTYAPDIYRRVRSICRDGAGCLQFDTGDTVLDHALEMRRFDPDAVLSNHPEKLDGDLADQLGRTILKAQLTAIARPKGGGFAALDYVARSNAELLRKHIVMLGEDQVEPLIEATALALARLAPLLDSRRDQGMTRRCHGDLHLGNILLESGRPVLFDCIEFSDVLADIDILYDVAFTLMDLDYRGRRDAGVRLLGGWLDQAARQWGQALWSGLEALGVCLSIRAAVRCHVRAEAGDPEQARAYLAAARAHLEPCSASLIAVGGLSGSGKSTIARRLAPTFGSSPGAVILRTDEIRKRLAGVEPTGRLDPDAYSLQSSARVYGCLFETADWCLKAGRAVVLDGVFLRPEERQRAEDLARENNVRFQGLWMEATPDVLLDRVSARRGDASDADQTVVRSQLKLDPGIVTWNRTGS
jgi:aminoglycoside phosphotransferase family enzyme/predicted kinase